MNKESILYISTLQCISDACSETDIRVETIHSELSRLAASYLLTKLLSQKEVLHISSTGRVV